MCNKVRKHGEVINAGMRKLIADRYHVITKAINKKFWNLASETKHSLYVGSYGRGTAIETSDIDIVVELPHELLNRFNNRNGNGQSQLLQAAREPIRSHYLRSAVSADGQVIKINFCYGIRFEIVPAFKRQDGIYIYPDSNTGGKWRSTNPKAEQRAMVEKNKTSNGLLYDTCKHIRSIRDEHPTYHLPGIVIDSFVYRAIGNWSWWDGNNLFSYSSESYERALLGYYERYRFLFKQSINAPWK